MNIYALIVIIFLFLGYVIYTLSKCYAINTIAKNKTLSDKKAKYICDKSSGGVVNRRLSINFPTSVASDEIQLSCLSHPQPCPLRSVDGQASFLYSHHESTHYSYYDHTNHDHT